VRGRSYLLVDQLFANSIRHSGSGAPGETVTVAVKTADDVIRVEVTDLSGPGVPQPRHSGSEAEDGRGLHLVARLAARWGWRRRGGGTVTWFEDPDHNGAGTSRIRTTTGRERCDAESMSESGTRHDEVRQATEARWIRRLTETAAGGDHTRAEDEFRRLPPDCGSSRDRITRAHWS
jgi:histidine kinase-like protein